MTRLLAVGADAAGLSAAHQALRTAQRAGRDLEVVALERTIHTSYSACGLPYCVAGDVDRPTTSSRAHWSGVDTSWTER